VTLVREFLDAVTAVPFMVWVLILVIGVLTWLAYLAVATEMTKPEQREAIAEAHRELRGARGMPSISVGLTAHPEARASGTSQSTSSGRAASAHRVRRPDSHEGRN
jgi:hypothetical protein